MMQQNFNLAKVMQYLQFRQNFQGNAEEEIKKLLQSGQMNQQQLNYLQKEAADLQQMLCFFFNR